MYLVINRPRALAHDEESFPCLRSWHLSQDRPAILSATVGVGCWHVGRPLSRHVDVTQGMPRSGCGGPRLRRHGDEVQRLPGGYYRALGRTDDTMNLGGIKVPAVALLAAAAALSSSRHVHCLTEDLTARTTCTMCRVPGLFGNGHEKPGRVRFAGCCRRHVISSQTALQNRSPHPCMDGPVHPCTRVVTECFNHLATANIRLCVQRSRTRLDESNAAGNLVSHPPSLTWPPCANFRKPANLSSSFRTPFSHISGNDMK